MSKLKKGRDYIGVGVGGVLVNENNEVLLLKRKYPPEVDHWTIPGGSVQFGERVAEALVREFREELGVDIEVICFLTLVDHIVPEDQMHFVSSEHLVKLVRGAPKNMETDKHSEMRWHPLDALPEKLTLTSSQAIDAYRQHRE